MRELISQKIHKFAKFALCLKCVLQPVPLPKSAIYSHSKVLLKVSLTRHSTWCQCQIGSTLSSCDEYHQKTTRWEASLDPPRGESATDLDIAGAPAKPRTRPAWSPAPPQPRGGSSTRIGWGLGRLLFVENSRGKTSMRRSNGCVV